MSPALNAFQVLDPKVSPARLRLDASQHVQVALYLDTGGGEEPLESVEGVAGNSVELPQGESFLSWDFQQQLGNSNFHRNVRLLARAPGGGILSGGSTTVGLGNDAPVVFAVEPKPTDPSNPGESSGNVEIRLGISDTSIDPFDSVDVTVEWRRNGDPSTWFRATPAGVFANGIETPPTPGIVLSFFWNTNVDLPGEEETVFFRVTAFDRTDTGTLETSAPFRIDNNAEPIVQLDSGPLILDPDGTRGVPVPFRVIDAEGDSVEVLFQWRARDEGFPSLDLDGNGRIESADIDAALATPDIRRARNICAQYPRFASGRVVPVDEISVRLPELAGEENWILAKGVEGLSLEILRPSSVPAPISPPWTNLPFTRPVAALPIGEGLSALVLDALGPTGPGRVCEIDLATGLLLNDIADLDFGVPTAMALESGEQAVLVATDCPTRILRVALPEGPPVDLLLSGDDPGPVRGIASLGSGVLVFTADSALWFLDYRDRQALRSGRLLTGLARPSGVVAAPSLPHRIYLSERDADRVLAVDLDSRGGVPIAARTAEAQIASLPSPGPMALEHNDTRLLVVTHPLSGASQLVGIELGAVGGNILSPIGEPQAALASSIATGPNGLRLMAMPTMQQLFLGGGLQQRRSVVALDPESPPAPRSQFVVVDRAFDPVPGPGSPWRLPLLTDRVRASPEGVDGVFLWDSSDAGAKAVFLRAFARDSEVGVAAAIASPKAVRNSFEDGPVTLGTANGLPSVVPVDLDGDGDLDLLTAPSRAFLQNAPGAFIEGILPLASDCVALAAADIDDDGDTDVASARNATNALRILFQNATGGFDGLDLGGPATTRRPRAVALADMNADGRLDVVVANELGNEVTLFLQQESGSFTPMPLDAPGSTSSPASLAPGDFDGDGDVDLVTANLGTDDLTLFIRLQDGLFATRTLGGPSTTKSPYWVAAADIDGEGGVDIVSANAGRDDLTLFLQQSSGALADEPLVLGGSLVTRSPRGLALADLDGNRRLDIVSANTLGNNVTAFLQLPEPGATLFPRAPLVLGGPGLSSGALAVAAADFDGDGQCDIASANGSGSGLSLFFQHGRARLADTPAVLGGPTILDVPRSLEAVDLDGDGDLDLLTANQDGNDLRILFQDADDDFRIPPTIVGDATTTPVALQAIAADLNGDATLDLVCASYGADHLAVFFQDKGVFRDALVLGSPSTTGKPGALVAIDLDCDGDLDLVSANQGQSDLALFMQNDHGSFDTAPRVVLGGPTITDLPVALAAYDLDGDGDQDLVTANRFGNDLTLFVQRNPWTFEPLRVGGRGRTDGPMAIAVADLDGDGQGDLVSANAEGNTVSVFFQRAPLDFDSTPLVLGGFPLTWWPESLAVADLDGDGSLDLACGNRFGNNLIAFRQGAPGVFRSSPRVLGGLVTTRRPASLAAVDLDGDGDRELLSANAGGNDITIFWGGR